VLFRARIQPGTNGDCTVKLRPCTQSKVSSTLQSASGFKVNYDLMEKGDVLDCSISATVTNTAIASVANGKSTIKSLFNSN